MLAVFREEERCWSTGDIEGYVNLYDIKKRGSLWQSQYPCFL